MGSWIKTSVHEIFVFKTTEETDAIAWAHETALKKCSYTQDSWQNRSPCKRFTNIFLGDLAKNLIMKFLRDELRLPDASLVEYDRIRTDGFKCNDMFDLAINSVGGRKNIEVKSSGEKFSGNLDKLMERRIIVNMNNVHTHFEWLAVQVLFVPENLSFFKNEDFDCGNLPNFAQHYVQTFLAQNVLAYAMAYATREMQEQAAKETFMVSNPDAGANQRSYANIQIKNALPLRQLEAYVKRML